MRKQEPKNSNNWLFRDLAEDNRVFSKVVYLGKNDTEWDECTNEEKQAWETEHPVPEPEEPMQENL